MRLKATARSMVRHSGAAHSAPAFLQASMMLHPLVCEAPRQSTEMLNSFGVLAPHSGTKRTVSFPLSVFQSETMKDKLSVAVRTSEPLDSPMPPMTSAMAGARAVATDPIAGQTANADWRHSRWLAARSEDFGVMSRVARCKKPFALLSADFAKDMVLDEDRRLGPRDEGNGVGRPGVDLYHGAAGAGHQSGEKRVVLQVVD